MDKIQEFTKAPPDPTERLNEKPAWVKPTATTARVQDVTMNGTQPGGDGISCHS
jgi:hypothetical protein